MLGVAPFDAASERPRCQHIGMQITVNIGNGQKCLPNCNESEKQERNGPTRFDTIHPAQKWPSPTRIRNLRARNNCRERRTHRYTNSLHAVGKTNSSPLASRKVTIRPALPDSVWIFIKKSGSPWNRMGKFEGLKGHKARYFRHILYFCRVRNLAQMPDGKTIETLSAALGYLFI